MEQEVRKMERPTTGNGLHHGNHARSTKIPYRTEPPQPPGHLKGIRAIRPHTPTLAGPQVVSIPVEGHEKDVVTASILIPIEAVQRVTSHPGLASSVHLWRDIPSWWPQSIDSANQKPDNKSKASARCPVDVKIIAK